MGVRHTSIAAPTAIARANWNADHVVSLPGYAPSLRPLQERVMASPPTIGTLSDTSAISGGILWSAKTLNSASAIVAPAPWSYSNAYSLAVHGSGSFYVYAPRTSEVNGSDRFAIDFWFDGTELELAVAFRGQLIHVWVDDELVSATATSITHTSYGLRYLPITFASRAVRRIRISGISDLWGLQTGANDSVWASPLPGPRVHVITDSFGTGTSTGNGEFMSWAHVFGRAMGWPDLLDAHNGGSGWVKDGSPALNFQDRISEVTTYAADVVVWAGGFNDAASYTAAEVRASADACLGAVAEAMPNALQIVVGPWCNAGIDSDGVKHLDFDVELRAAAAAVDGIFVSLHEDDIDADLAVSTTLSAQASSGATSISTTAIIPSGSTVEIGTGSTRCRRRVTYSSGSGPYVYAVTALGATYASGSSVVVKGPSLWTGTGDTNTAGSGNCPVLVGNDGIHPSQAGHDLIGRVIAQRVRAQLAAQP